MVSNVQRIFHFVAFALFLNAVVHEFFLLPTPDHINTGANTFGGKFKFLTVWDEILQLVFYSICIANNIFGSNALLPSKRSSLERLKDFVFAAWALPIACIVCGTFWALYSLVGRETVYPEILDTVIPKWMNLSVHAAPFICIVIEMLISYHHYPKRYAGMFSIASFIIIYILWLQVIGTVSGIWVYPILGDLNWWQYILFVSTVAVITILFYIAGNVLNNTIWKNAVKNKFRKTSSSRSESLKKQN